MAENSTGQWMARGPLGIIALFISLIYAISALLLAVNVARNPIAGLADTDFHGASALEMSTRYSKDLEAALSPAARLNTCYPQKTIIASEIGRSIQLLVVTGHEPRKHNRHMETER